MLLSPGYHSEFIPVRLATTMPATELMPGPSHGEFAKTP